MDRAQAEERGMSEVEWLEHEVDRLTWVVPVSRDAERERVAMLVRAGRELARIRKLEGGESCIT